MNYDRIIIELIERISVLEDEVRILKEGNTQNENHRHQNSNANSPQQLLYSSASSKDTTKYIFEGKRYGKNRLVLAIIKRYVELHKDISAQELMWTFDRTLQGSLGVVRTVEDVRSQYNDCERRFFLEPEDIIHTITLDCAVCTQWAAFNINNLIARAEELGFSITII